MREVIAAQYTPQELASIANAFERDRERLTRGFRRDGREDGQRALLGGSAAEANARVIGAQPTDSRVADRVV